MPNVEAYPLDGRQKLRLDQKTLAISLVQEGRSISEVARTFSVHRQPSIAVRIQSRKVELTDLMLLFCFSQPHRPPTAMKLFKPRRGFGGKRHSSQCDPASPTIRPFP